MKNTKVPMSLNPTYVQRVVLPFKAYICPRWEQDEDFGHYEAKPRVRSEGGKLQLEEDPKAPLPPVALVMEDRDEGNILTAGKDNFTEMATVFNLTPKNLDRESNRFREFSGKPKGVLDLDVAHTPLWQALNL